MNKQELIKKMESQAERYSEKGAWPHIDTWNAYVRAIGWARELDEPHKPVVPSCAEPWLKNAQYSSDVIDLFSEVEYATDSDGFISKHWRWSPEFYDWLSEDADTLYLLCDALRYGYEVEKEPTWVVVVDGGNYYFTHFNSSCDPNDPFHWSSAIEKDEGHHFIDKEMAEAVAKITGGEVAEG